MQGKDALLCCNLQHQIDIMGHGHELGKSWSAKDGMVRRVEISDEEVDIINAKMPGGAELSW